MTKEAVEHALGYTPADDAKSMEYYIITFDGEHFKDKDGNALTFSQIKTLCLDEKHFVYCQYENDLYIPQHIQATQIYFDATYVRNHKVEIHRIGINANQTVNQEVVYPADSTELESLKDDYLAQAERIDKLEEAQNAKRYGVIGIGLANATLTRIYDAVGMVAQVGTDGDNSNVVNMFDDTAPFNRRKCVGEWHMVNGKPKFTVNAYHGDPDYTEDGSIGDYVAVDCPPAYYQYDTVNGRLVVSSFHYDGYRPFDCLMDR